MYADRYQSGQLNPGSLTLSVGIVGGLVAAAMLSTTVVEVITRDKPLKTYIVRPPEEAPPPDTPKPKVEPKAQTPTVTDPIVIPPTPSNDSFIVEPIPGPPPTTTFGTGEGNGAGTEVVDPPKPPPPVLTRADIDPRYVRDFQPLYPPAEQRAGNEGVVSLRVLIGPDGRVRAVERIASPSDAFWRVTEQRALAKWRFTPATRDGIPVESWKTMTVRFRLDQ